MKKNLFLLIAISLSLLSFASEPMTTSGITLPPKTIGYVQQKAATVDPAVKAKFDRLHADWYKAAQSDMKILLSSTMYSRRVLPQYAEMVEMGPVIIPLLMEKMLDENNFFSQIIYEALQTDKSLLPQKDRPTDAPFLRSAQNKAKGMIILLMERDRNL